MERGDAPALPAASCGLCPGRRPHPQSRPARWWLRRWVPLPVVVVERHGLDAGGDDGPDAVFQSADLGGHRLGARSPRAPHGGIQLPVARTESGNGRLAGHRSGGALAADHVFPGVPGVRRGLGAHRVPDHQFGQFLARFLERIRLDLPIALAAGSGCWRPRLRQCGPAPADRRRRRRSGVLARLSRTFGDLVHARVGGAADQGPRRDVRSPAGRGRPDGRCHSRWVGHRRLAVGVERSLEQEIFGRAIRSPQPHDRRRSGQPAALPLRWRFVLLW